MTRFSAGVKYRLTQLIGMIWGMNSRHYRGFSRKIRKRSKKMKITDIKAFTVDCFRTNWVFVKVYTDEGITGVGEGTLEYKENAFLGALEHIKEYLLGKNPLEIEKHWHSIYRDAYWRGGPVLMSALSAVEMALWDNLGKSLNEPVYQLLGG